MRIKKLIISSFLVITLIFIAGTVVNANSLWSENQGSMYSDKEDYEIGDLITVLIEEDASAVQSAVSDSTKGSELDVGAGSGILSFLNPFSFGYSGSDSADGSTERTGTLQADITVTIVEEMENGNFKIAGDKNIKINDETQAIKLTGTIRESDIRANNTIESKLVADPEIEYEGKGIIGDKQDRGIISRIFNFIF
ncbi:MAG: flagellar basal body L-ring protein FlgH [Halarsenatibacteraceae bacterium]